MKHLENSDIGGMGFDLNPIVGILYLWMVPALFLYVLLRLIGG